MSSSELVSCSSNLSNSSIWFIISSWSHETSRQNLPRDRCNKLCLISKMSLLGPMSQHSLLRKQFSSCSIRQSCTWYCWLISLQQTLSTQIRGSIFLLPSMLGAAPCYQDQAPPYSPGHTSTASNSSQPPLLSHSSPSPSFSTAYLPPHWCLRGWTPWTTASPWPHWTVCLHNSR